MPKPPAIGFAHRQRGAAAIEFAVVFMVFFTIFYGMIGYSIPFLLGATYQELAAEALREAIRTAHTRGLTEAQRAGHQARVLQSMRNTWLPASWASTCNGYGGAYLKMSGAQWSVCVRHANPESIMPPISLLGWKIPALPSEITGEAVICLYNNGGCAG